MPFSTEETMPLTSDDRLEIIELAARYSHAIDHLDAEAYANVFTEDGELYAGQTLRAAGHAALKANIAKAEAAKVSRRHWNCNPIVDGDGSTARLRVYLMAVEYTKSLSPYLMGEYDDELVKLNGKWKFKRRRIMLCAGGMIV
jgi:hypothetical protein